MAAATDRHLLFGLIALQVGLIDQAQLVAAFQAWARDKARSLADHLADRGGPDAEGRAAVEAMVALHIKKHGGDVEKSLAAIPAGRSTRESLAHIGDPRARHLARPASARRDRATTATPTAPPATPSAPPPATASGSASCGRTPRGGLGAVFVALDGELHREVALKQILDKHADDPVSRARFLLEAEITGGLEHPGIVPVYGLGTYADGRPYYAMRFIRGDTLKDAIAAFHADDRTRATPAAGPWTCASCCGGSLDVCNAIEYAHSAGCCTATSSRATSWSASTARRWWSTGAWPRRVGRSDRGAAIGERTLVPSSASGSRRDAARLGAGHAGIHEPRAGRAATSTQARPALATSTAWAPRSTAC